MVEKFKQILQKIIGQKGQVALFAILKMDEFTDKWTVILSANWIHDNNTSEVFNFTRQLLLKTLTDDEGAMIAALVISTKSEHIVQELLKYKAGTILNEDVKINGNIVHEVHILASNSEA